VVSGKEWNRQNLGSLQVSMTGTNYTLFLHV
jgi:hypothetical protein